MRDLGKAVDGCALGKDFKKRFSEIAQNYPVEFPGNMGR